MNSERLERIKKEAVSYDKIELISLNIMAENEMFAGLFDNFNAQVDRVNKIAGNIQFIVKQIEAGPSVDEDAIQQDYKDYLDGLTQSGNAYRKYNSFEEFRTEVMKAEQEKIANFSGQLDRLIAEYRANKKYLAELKLQKVQEIIQFKKSLERKLDDVKSRLSNPDLTPKETLLINNEIKNLEDALNDLTEIENVVRYTHNIDYSTLAPHEMEIYNDIVKEFEPNLDSDEFIEDMTDETGDDETPEEEQEKEEDDIEKDPDGDTSSGDDDETPEEEEEKEEDDIEKDPDGDTSSGDDDETPEEEEEKEEDDEKKPIPPVLPPDGPVIEVVKMTPWEWIKAHKKQILIALGLTALAVSAIVLFTQILPAIAAAQNLQSGAGILQAMVNNGSMWHAASTAEQAALHAANTALASNLSSLTGVAATYAEGTGIWTIGGQSLSTAAAAATKAAAAAASKLSVLNGLGLGFNLGGLTALGTGLLMKNKSERFKELKAKIEQVENGFMNSLDGLTEEIVDDAFGQIIYSINNDSELTASEKAILLKKIKKAKMKIEAKIQDMNPELEEITQEESFQR